MMPNKDGYKEKFAERVDTYIEVNYDTDITTEQIARHAGYSLFHTKHMYKEVTGKTLLQSVKAKRLEKMKELLSTTDWSFAKIVAAVGYSAVGSIGCLFKVETGYTPAAYRRAFNKDVA